MKNPNHIIAVVGGKGGVGKSVLTANLAFAMRKELKAPTLLVDLDQKSCGDQNIITGLKPVKTVSQMASYKGVVSAATLRGLFAHHPSGLAYLAGVTGPDQTLSADVKLFTQQMAGLQRHYKYIFVDMGCTIGDLQLALMDYISVLLVVVSPEILVVNQTKRTLNELSQAALSAQLMQVIVNKKTDLSVPVPAIGQALKLPILHTIPSDEKTAFQSLQNFQPFVLSQPNTAISKSCHEVIRRLTGGILQRNKELSRPKIKKPELKSLSGEKNSPSSPASGKTENIDPLTLLKMQIHTELIQEMDLKKDLRQAKDEGAKKEIRVKATTVVTRLVDKRGQGLSRAERSQVIKQVIDEALGLGALEDLLSDPSVTEIMVNGAQQIYCEKAGKLQLSKTTFTSNNHLKNVIERIVTPLGRRIDEKTPYVDARLADGSRVNAVIEPLSIDGPALTIRKFPSERIVIDDLVDRFHSMTKAMADFLKICVQQGLNIIISGGTGSGKTTLLNVMSSFIPNGERIVTVEDAAELQLKQDHVVRLETRPANMEGTGEITIRDLIRNSLRMRPDRIIVGECRDGAALDMLSAMNTGHDGSMTTVHSNNPREAVSRLETLCMMAGMELPAKAIREQIAGAVNLIVQISRLSDGSRKILHVSEIVGMQGDVVTIQEIFRFKEESFDKNRKIIGQFQALGRIPTFIEKFERKGIHVPRDLFTTEASSEKKPAAKPGIKKRLPPPQFKAQLKGKPPFTAKKPPPPAPPKKEAS